MLKISKTLALKHFSSSPIITSGLYVPGNQERMLTKCVTANSTLIVPDMEDSVPPEQKPEARRMIKDKLGFIRENVRKNVVVTPRTNGPQVDDGELFKQDIAGILDSQSCALINGICVPKVDTVSDFEIVDYTLWQVE